MDFTLIIVDYFTQLVENGTSKSEALTRTLDKAERYSKLGYINNDADYDILCELIHRLATI